jgi:K+ transporter
LGILDFSYFYVPPVIWFWLVILGGSGTNHLIVNPAMIGCVSGLYLLRFYLQYFESKPVKGTVLLWLLILVICSIIHMVLPTFPE